MVPARCPAAPTILPTEEHDTVMNQRHTGLPRIRQQRPGVKALTANASHS
jgi:hypothetical protein